MNTIHAIRGDGMTLRELENIGRLAELMGDALESATHQEISMDDVSYDILCHYRKQVENLKNDMRLLIGDLYV